MLTRAPPIAHEPGHNRHTVPGPPVKNGMWSQHHKSDLLCYASSSSVAPWIAPRRDQNSQEGSLIPPKSPRQYGKTSGTPQLPVLHSLRYSTASGTPQPPALQSVRYSTAVGNKHRGVPQGGCILERSRGDSLDTEAKLQRHMISRIMARVPGGGMPRLMGPWPITEDPKEHNQRIASD